MLIPRLLALVALALSVALGGCNGSATPASGRPSVVAAENFWGSLARQLAGDRLTVASIVTDPGTDPHAYEPTAADSRTLAGARMAIVNGLGYDPWAPRLLAASPAPGRVVLDVGHLLALRAGENPHRWYSPPDVRRVIGAITADYMRIDPRDASYFTARRTKLEAVGLAPYRGLLASMRQRYGGVPIGASESIIAPLAQAAGLRLITPMAYMRATSEGTEPSAQDRTAVERQIAAGQVKVWIYNSQNATPDIQRLTAAARAAHIPVVTVTETLTPLGASFEDWQVAQLRALDRALSRVMGR